MIRPVSPVEIWKSLLPATLVPAIETTAVLMLDRVVAVGSTGSRALPFALKSVIRTVHFRVCGAATSALCIM